MAWARMQFKGEAVWARVGPDGKLALDREGRAEMKYRSEDERSYRPSAVNLTPIEPGSPDAAGTPPRDEARGEARRSSASTAPDGSLMVWTDGACSGNPGPMGIGVVVLDDGKRREVSEYLGHGTNNIAELVAIQRGLELADQLDPERTRPVRVHTDSGYSIGVLSKGWKAKANQELITAVRRLLATRPAARLVKVAGHAGVPENERCDELARDAVVKRGSA